MPGLIALLVACSVILVLLVVVQFRTARPAVVDRRLDEIAFMGTDAAERQRRRRQAQSERLRNILQAIGEKVEGRNRGSADAVRRFLVQGGYSDPNAVTIYWALRFTLAVGLGVAMLLLLPLLKATPLQVLLAVVWFAALGWIGPSFYVGARVRRRQREMQRTLPDLVDMLVVCVEAGLGLNQALQRVADEIEHVSPVLSDQVSLVNLEIRAGTPRDEALRNLAERTGLADVRSLTSMLIQTEKFGTSVASTLRVFSDTLRTKRRQRAEEAAAKTTIKLVFPLVLCVFPAMFVVVLGPPIIMLYRMVLKYPGAF